VLLGCRADGGLAGYPGGREKTMIKLLYKPVDLIASMVGGLLAGLIFRRVWKLIGQGRRA
jgi:hypothetical protein